jgi:toxin ParE1/3/4
MPRVLRRPRANDDIAEIWDFIAEDSLAAADGFVERLDREFRLLASQPMMGRARDELAPGLRSMPFMRYVVFYEPVREGIIVVRVIHSARDIGAHFEDPMA